MILGKIELLKWKDILDYDDDKSPSSTLLRCPIHGIYVGWLNDDGWHDVGSEEFTEPVSPQPTYYMEQKNG